MEEQLRQLDLSKAFLIGLFFAGLYYLGVYNSGEQLESKIKTVQGQISQKQAELVAMNKTIEDAKRHTEVAKKLGLEMEAVLRAVPAKFNSLELMKVLSDEAKVVGANIVNLAPASQRGAYQNVVASPFKPIEVSVILQGTFNQLMLFMSNLTKVSKIILIKDMELSQRDPGKVFEATSPMLKFMATFQAYRYEVESEAKGGR